MTNEEISNVVTAFKQLNPAIQSELLDLMREMVQKNEEPAQASGTADWYERLISHNEHTQHLANSVIIWFGEDFVFLAQHILLGFLISILYAFYMHLSMIW